MGRVAITGLGVICSIGRSFDDYVEGLRRGEDGLVEPDDPDGLSAIARIAEVRDWMPTHDEGIADELVGSARRCEQLALDAAHQAIDQSGLRDAELPSHRVGVFVGTCQGFVGELSSYQRLGSNLAVSHVADDLARQLNFRGPAITTTNACSASGAAIALGYDQIRRGRLDAVIAGGADAVALFTVAGFASLRSLDPLGCSPYGRSEGLSIGEGAGFLVLEDLDSARARGAAVIIELAGAGMSADAYHPTAPDPTGRGAILAVERALRAGGLAVDEIQYVNGHGTGTPANDEMERTAFRLLLGDRLPRVPISSTKSQIGHTLGAAGVLEAAACIAAVTRNVLPPTLRLPDRVDPEGFDFVAEPGRHAEIEVAASVNYAFGGSNSALVLAEPGVLDGRPAVAEPIRRCVITGIGLVGALGLGTEEWVRRLEGAAATALTSHDVGSGRTVLAAPIPPLTKRFAAGTAWRKMDEFERATVASAQLAWKDAGLRLSNEAQQEVAVIFATQTGSVGSIVEFSEQAMLSAGADPALFPHTAINAASGHVCTTMGLRGPNLSISSGGASSLSALETAVALIERGAIDVALVCSTDDLPVSALSRFPRAEHAEGIHPAFTLDTVRPFDASADGAAPGGAAVTLVIEAEEHAAARGATSWAEVGATALVVASDPTPAAQVAAWRDAYEAASQSASVPLEEIDVCFAAANGIRAADRVEATALAELLDPTCLVTAPKSVVGDCIGTSGAVGVAFAALALRDGVVVPNVGLREDPGDGLRHVRGFEPVSGLRNAAVGVTSGSGSYGVVILKASG